MESLFQPCEKVPSTRELRSKAASSQPREGRRVAHVLRKYDPLEWGGTETHVTSIVSHLGPLGWQSEVHAPRGPKTPDSALPSHVPLRRYRAFCPFVASAERRKALWANAGNIVSLEEPFRLARDRSLSLVHAHTCGRVGGGVRTALRLTGRPYVVSVHGPLLAEKELVADDSAKRLRGTIDLGRPLGAVLGSRRVLDDAARVITFNDAEHRAMSERIGTRAVRMDHGVDAAVLGAGDENRARTRWSALGDAPFSVLLGRIARQKNQLLALRAFADGAPSHHHLVFAGAATDQDYPQEVEAEIARLGLSHRVHLLGNIGAKTEVPDLLAAAELVLAPSTHEAFGLCVLEGWAAGKAVLFSNATGPASLARRLDDDSCMARSLELEEWSALISQTLSSPERCEAFASDGHRLVQTRYTWSAAAKQLAGLYDEVLEEVG